VSARSLQSELTCPICLDMLTATMTTKECLHRSKIVRLKSPCSIRSKCPYVQSKITYYVVSVVRFWSVRQKPGPQRLVRKTFISCAALPEMLSSVMF
jgi:hypothetical protein